jgi:hypothetical protein
MTRAAINNLANSNEDPIKDFADSVGVVNSPASGLSAPPPTKEF